MELYKLKKQIARQHRNRVELPTDDCLSQRVKPCPQWWVWSRVGLHGDRLIRGRILLLVVAQAKEDINGSG